MDFPILLTWMSPFSFSGASGVFFISISFFDENHVKANRIAPDGTPSHLGRFCLPVSHKKDARLIWINLTTGTVVI